jgi:hypothetical protein
VIARLAADLERAADADEETELPDVLRLFPYRKALAVHEYADPGRVRGAQGAREARRPPVTLRDLTTSEAPRCLDDPPA